MQTNTIYANSYINSPSDSHLVPFHMTDAVTGLFSYNRETFKFDAEIHQQEQFMRQKMRTRQIMLYREDLRDLFGLTIGRMDSYMLVNVLMMGICGEMYYKGRTPTNVPVWIFWIWSITLSSAMFFLLLSLWLALHASVDAQTFMTRSLTQWLRLPVPSKKEIEEATLHAEDFESKGVSSFVKIPVAVNLETPAERATLNDPSAIALRESLRLDYDRFRDHFKLFNSVHRKWQGHEAYTRVCTYMGTNQLLFAVAYFGIAYYGLDFATPWVGWAIAALTTVVGILHARINLVLNRKEFVAVFFLATAAPLCACIACGLEDTDPSSTSYGSSAASRFLGCAAIACHAALLYLYLSFAQGKSRSSLPVKFSTVWGVENIGIDAETERRLTVDFRRTSSLDETALGIARTDTNLSLEDTASLNASLKRTETVLQKLFDHWQVKSGELSEDQVRLVMELKEEFKKEKSGLKRQLTRDGTSRTLSAGLDEAQMVNKGWVRLEYTTPVSGNTGIPYFLNVETGELQWDAPDQDEALMQRGLSVLPEKMAEYREAAKAVSEQKKERRLLKNPERISALGTAQPWLLYRIGIWVIIGVCCLGFLLLLLQAVGVYTY